MLHPSVRIVLLLIVAVGMIGGGWPALVLASGCVALAASSDSLPRLQPTFAAIRRVRWLLLSIVVFYGWFMPDASGLRPSVPGLMAGAHRAAVLIVMVLGAQLLLARVERGRLTAGLLWLLMPLRGLRLPVERIALRLVLVFDNLASLEAIGRQAGGGDGPRWRRIARSVSAVIEDVVARAETGALPTLELPSLPRPPAGQWLLPLLAAAGFALL